MILRDPSLDRSQITLKAMLKTIHKNKGGILVELQRIGFDGVSIENTTTLNLNEVPDDLKGVLQQYLRVFHMPSSLPPLRQRQHQITLKEGSNPLSVRPYRYPQIQKEEIEKLVVEMLQAGIIQPSQSVFKSSIIGKEERWVVAFLR